MYDVKLFSTKLRELLSLRGINQTWIADKLSTTPATVSRYVSGERIPSLENLVDLAHALNVSVDALLGVEKPIQRRVPDVSILTECYEKAPASIRKIIWASLDPYMSPEQRVVIEASETIEQTHVG